MAGRGVYKTFLPAFVFTPKGNGYTCRTYTSQGIRDISFRQKNCILHSIGFQLIEMDKKKNLLRMKNQSQPNEKSFG